MTRTYGKWSKIPNKAGVNGHQVARHILDTNGLQKVTLEVSKGQLSDHYIPSQKLMRLSQDINNQPSVASIAVAAHECGHAIQDKEGYAPLKFYFDLSGDSLRDYARDERRAVVQLTGEILIAV